MTRGLLLWPCRHPGRALALAALTTLLLAGAGRGVQARYEVEDFFPAGTPERGTYERLRALFGRDDRTGLVVIEAARALDAADFARLDALTRRLEARPDVESVRSPTNADLVVRRGEDVRLERAVPREGPLTQERVDAALEAYRLPPYAGSLVSPDQRLAVIGVTLAPDRLRFADRAALLADLELEAAGLRAAGYTVHLAGYPLHRVRLAHLAGGDSLRFVPWVLAVVLAITALAFRSLAAAGLVLAVTGAAVVWTTGLMALCGLPPNIFGPAVYVMVVVVGVADPVHLVARQRELLAEGAPRAEAVSGAWRDVGLPCLLASLTTALAFVSLVLTGIPLVAHMGLQVTLGVLAAFALTWLVHPSLSRWVSAGAGAVGRLPAALVALDAWAAPRARGIVLASALLLIVSAVGAARLRVNAPLLSDLDPEHPVRVANRLLEERLGGVIPLDLLIEPASEMPRGARYSGDRLRRVEALTERLRELDGVVWATSAVDVLRRLGPLLQRVPEDDVPGLLPTALLLANRQVVPWVHEESDVLRVRLRLRDLDTEAAFALFGRIEATAREVLGAHERVALTGQGYLGQVVNRSLVRYFAGGFLVSLAGVALTLCVLARDVRLALASLAPNLLPLVTVAGLMGALGIELRYTSALVLAVVFGLAVDDTIHVVAQLRRQRGAPDPVARTLRVAGPGLVWTSLLLAAGFATLLAAEFLPLRVMGQLLAITAALALAGDLVLLPALVRVLSRAQDRSQAAS